MPDINVIQIHQTSLQPDTGLAKNGEHMKVPAPKGYHWMKSGKSFKLMKDPAGGYKPHKGASKSANFEVQKVHKGK